MVFVPTVGHYAPAESHGPPGQRFVVGWRIGPARLFVNRGMMRSQGLLSNRSFCGHLPMRLCAAPLVLSLVLGAATLAPVVAHANIVAATAADICPINADPCNVTTQIDVVNNSTLDFGTRNVSVSGSGRFNFGAGNGAIKCGNFTASPGNGNYAINAAGPGAANTTRSGSIEVDARRSCSTHSRPCVKESDCHVGGCSVRRCSLHPARPCTQDSDCNLGTCAFRRCSLNNQVRCTTNQDCNFGGCPAQLTCQYDGTNPIACTTDADCEFGTCSVGSASIDMNGPIAGNSDAPASISLLAADNITIRKDINLHSTSLDGDGGELEMTATWGDVQVLSPAGINVAGGGFAAGGMVTVLAGHNFKLNGDIDCTGGDFDGGSLDATVAGDVTIARDINCSAVSGAGSGGEILVDAAGDLSVSGVSALNHTDLLTQSHTDAENNSGDGGTQELTAGGNLSLSPFTTYQGSGAAPEGSGSDLFLTADGSFLLGGVIESRSAGVDGGGGFVEVFSGGTAKVAASGFIDLFGGSGGGGSMKFVSVGAADFKGTADATAGSQGAAGSLFITSDSDLSFAGRLTTNGGSGNTGRLNLEACRITLTSTAFLDNKAPSGLNRLKVHESMKLQSGSRIVATGGSNLLIYRTEKPQNVTLGTITPAPQILFDPLLVGCPVCGNGEIDQTETCDDGNTLGGDGCTADCQNENCIAQTPGYPAVALCSDGDDCSLDTCNTALNGGTCQHQQSCDDGIACTSDGCVDAQCVHTPVDAACDDGNACTDDLCSDQTGCSHVASSSPCDDGKFCTEGDHCSAKICIGSAIDCSDAVACTVDTCNETLRHCIHQPADALCSDGIFCDGVETCDAAAGCQAGTPVVCSQLDGACVTGICDEAADTCSTAPANEGGPCDDANACTTTDTCTGGTCTGGLPLGCDDFNPCTDDGCDSASGCTHVNNSAACDDGDACTSSDACSSGLCTGQPVANCGCGDGVVANGEDCDDGDTVFVAGQYCGADCRRIPCGKPLNSTGALPKAGEALFTLRSAVGSSICDRRICDVDDNKLITASDALRILKAAVGQPITLTCPIS